MFVNTLDLLNREKWDLVSSRYLSREFSAKILRRVPCLRAHYIFMMSWCSCENHMCSWLAFVSQSGSETSPILLKFSGFPAQLSGYSADFHRKSLDIIKQHPNNAAIWANSCFSPVIIRDIGEHKFDGYGSEKIGSWKMEKNWGFGNPKSS